MHQGVWCAEFAYYDRSVGSFRVHSVSVFPRDGVVYFLTGGFFREGWGFMYDPQGHNPEIPFLETRPICPGWSVFDFAKP